MRDILYITGHKNPDSDSICASIAYAEYKNRSGNLYALPMRLGELNRETEFILNYFGVDEPPFIDTVKVQVQDLNIDKVAPISADISLKTAWEIMKKNNMKTLPIVDDNNKLLGIITITNITSAYMDIWNSNIISKSLTKLDNILDTLSAKCEYSPSKPSTFIGKILVAAMDPSTIQTIVEEGDIVICGNREDAQELILKSKASLMIITGNNKPSDKILNKAKEAQTSIITTPYDTFTTARLITQSIPVSYVMMKENVIKFRNDDFIDDIKDIMLKTRYRSYPVVDKGNHVIGTVSRYHLISSNKKKVIIVDHNERTQSVEGIEDAEVVEIIDHHRIADIQTVHPIYFRNEPVGSTSTIIASIFFENGMRPSKKIAGILAAAIISDTLYFKSPTSTNIDKLMVGRLSEIAGIDTDNFAKEMFKAGTSLKGKTPKEIFNQDLKIFNLDNLRVGISQVNTMDMESFVNIREEMLSLMEKKAHDEEFHVLILMLTDILKDASELLVAGSHKEIVSRAFKCELVNNSMYLPNILSRKKQVIPPISAAIADGNSM